MTKQHKPNTIERKVLKAHDITFEEIGAKWGKGNSKTYISRLMASKLSPKSRAKFYQAVSEVMADRAEGND